MAKNGFWDAAKKLDMVAASLATFGPIRAAHRTVRDLQQEGPSWTGKFSNSWQVSTPDGRFFKGDGGEGEPRQLPIPALTGRQAVRAGFAIDRAVFTISNFSPYAAEATDLVESAFIRPTPEPKTQLGRSKFRQGAGGREFPSYRGLIGTGDLDRESSATADLDWFAMYVEGGKLDRAVKIEMDDLFTELR
jgi:hypothetical protein